MSARSAAAALATACVAAGCTFGKPCGPTAMRWLLAVDPPTLDAQPLAADGALPAEFCRASCGAARQEIVEACHVATLGAVRAVLWPAASAPPPPIGTKLLECRVRAPGGGDIIIR